MADTRFTALGMSGSGKTCYILGMYYDMCVGRNGFTLVTDNAMASKLERWMDIIDNCSSGMDRFPAGTPASEVIDYSFKLCHNNMDIMSFDWSDYAGGALRQKEENPEVFDKLQKSIGSSTALYIFVDGEYFCDESPDKRIKNVKRKCAAIINPYIKKFYDTHNGKLPPIIFVVTKTDLCRKYVTNNDIVSVIKESFSLVFAPNVKTFITGVSLGSNLSDDDYRGEVDPVNIHIPFFIGIFYEFYHWYIAYKNKVMADRNKSERQISLTNQEIQNENSKYFIFPFLSTTDYDKVRQLQSEIESRKNTIAENERKLDLYRNLLKIVHGELVRQEKNYTIFKDGSEIEHFPDFDY